MGEGVLVQEAAPLAVGEAPHLGKLLPRQARALEEFDSIGSSEPAVSICRPKADRGARKINGLRSSQIAAWHRPAALSMKMQPGCAARARPPGDLMSLAAPASAAWNHVAKVFCSCKPLVGAPAATPAAAMRGDSISHYPRAPALKRITETAACLQILHPLIGDAVFDHASGLTRQEPTSDTVSDREQSRHRLRSSIRCQKKALRAMG